MTAKAWIDGVIVDASEARIPITDHGLLYGDGIFEGIRVFGGRVFRLDDHMARFRTGLSHIALDLPGGIESARRVVLETVRAHATQEAYVRLIATRGEGALGVDPTSCSHPRLLCLVDQIELYPEEKLAAGLSMLTSSLRRPPADVLDPRVKSLNYLNNVLAKLEAKQRGADEALLLNQAGRVAEAAVANVFIVRDGELLTPPTSDGALEGIVRMTVLELAGSLGIPAREKTLGRFDFLAADEAFLTGSGAGIVPVTSLDQRRIGQGQPGPIYAKLRAAFLDAAPGMGVPAFD
ncbi:MAG: branched-chain-amino-acid transaminase [Deltaproteobacteria bacterium]|nr:branched-chain-amino-acid transaminase [Myxococcales bacterium]TDJ13495.1 MAG: branched-chain-amino-acid transaminase [Deltaproteobacteria bacterium]TDJ18950.1 MAG: branched-chain-amino-acid transaminase [Deltaproteobacteria bacterium]